MSSKANKPCKPSSSKSPSKALVVKETVQPKPPLFLDQLEEDVTGTVVVMIGRIWDVNATTGRYLSTDFVVSNAKGNMIHCTARSSVAHNFLKMKVGGIYMIRNFVVLPNKDDFRVFRHDKYMLEFDGDTSSRKVSPDPNGFCMYPFQLMDFDRLEVAHNKYLTDVAGYVTNVGRTTFTKSGSKTLEFYLANQRGQSLRVTLWGGHGEVLVEKKMRHAGVCAMVLTGMSTKEYNNKLYLSSTSSTVILDDDDIPYLQELRADDSSAISTKKPLPIDCTHPREGTLENLLIWARNRRNNPATFLCKVVIENFRTKTGWNFPSCGYEKCRKGCSRKENRWLCESCNRVVEYPVFRYRLEAVVADDTEQTVIVLFNETATQLLNCSAESLMGSEDLEADAYDGLNLPLEIRNLIGTTHVVEIKSHTYYEYGNFESFNCSRIDPNDEAEADPCSVTPTAPTKDASHPAEPDPKQPSLDTPLKPNEGKKQKGNELEDSDVDEVTGPIKKNTRSSVGPISDKKKKRRQYIGDDTE